MKLYAIPDGLINIKRTYDEGKTFVFTVQTTGSPETFALPLEVSGTYDFTVDWGDSNSDNIMVWNSASVTHSYTNAGTYTITIVGIIQGWRFNNGGDKLKIYDVKSWGPLRLGNSNGYFFGCSNLTVSAIDALNITGITTLRNAFYDCSSLTTLDTSAWDIANVTTLHNAFYHCSSLTTLDTSTWDISSVATLYSIFEGCSSLATLDVSGWDTANVTTLYEAFRDCSSLTSLDVSGWNTANVTSSAGTFRGCSSLTTLALDSWDITSVTTMQNMLISVILTTTNYSDILVAFEAQAVLNNVSFHGGNSKYSAGAAATARAALIADHSWTITDGGQE